MEKKPGTKPREDHSQGGAPDTHFEPSSAPTQEFSLSNQDEAAAADFLLDDDIQTPAEKPAPEPEPRKPASSSDKLASPPPEKPAPKAAPRPGGSKPDAAKSISSGSGSQKAVTLGDYRLLKKLGQGGMGSVFLAQQTSLERDVALKVLSKELAGKPAFVQRFLREARVMAKLDHPNILRSLDVGEANGYHFLAMEFVDGGSVGGWLKKLTKFSIGDAMNIVLACARALQHAHEMNLIHRDIKPDNVLLTKKGVVKLADLGLAKALDEDMDLTRTGTGAGTPIYMAPEQAHDAKHVDGRCDIYALGCMFYVFLTGEPPFKGETLVDVISVKEKGKFPPARQFNDEIPERLDLIIDKMLTPKAEHRYPSCETLIKDLEELGLASEVLSFLSPAGAKAVAAKAPVPPAKKAAPTMAPSPAPAEPKEEPAYWYARFTSDGRDITRKLTFAEILDQIKKNTFHQETQVSRTLKGGYRSLGTYPEFQSIFKAKATQTKTERKAEKFKSFYEKIEQEERSRQRWRWIHNLYLRMGSGLGFILWIGLIAGIIVGLFFLGRWGLPILADKLGFK